jgi:tRNA A-37 threonylcarbamoyl transferase component Bud32/tetratricopeptide (TPR) repeat protein
MVALAPQAPPMTQREATDPGPSSERALIDAARREAAPPAGLARDAPPGHDRRPPSTSADTPRSDPTTPAASGAPALTGPVADAFPGYQLVREIRRGGQGVVYQAIQKTTRRKVAIKVMREGPFGDPREKARFEREVQILAQLSHPGIVAIHDSGTTPQGQFFYVMDYISGEPLDRFIARGPHDLADTLRLFIKICDAVNAAHLKGIIHRDLKPSNILIDTDGEPHVLDFGLAKVATGEVTEATRPQVMTVTGQFMGSLPWASPEQAEGRPDKIDIRTDVYSLGVVLYQLLVDRFPYDVVGSMRDVMTRILEHAPARPGAARRDVDHEVDTIVLKALAKQRERRYQSAGELARDLRHYLAGEAIEAKRDSIGYLLTKQLRRYRLPVAMGAAFVVVVTVGFVVSLGLWQAAAAARHAAEIETAKARQAAGFIANMLGATRRERDVRVRDVLDMAAAELDDGAMAGQPLIEAEVRLMLVRSYHALGLSEPAEAQARAAERLRREALGPGVPLADTMSWQVVLLNEQGRFAEAEPIAKRAVAMYKTAITTPTHPDAKDIPESLNNLAVSLIGQEKHAEAETICLEALERKRSILRLQGREHGPSIAYSLGTLAAIQHDGGKYADAEATFNEAIAIWRQTPDARLELAMCLTNFGRLLADQGRLAQAEAAFQESRRIYEQIRVDNHPDVALTLDSLGAVVLDQGRAAEAEAILRRSLEVRLSPPPPGLPSPLPWRLPITRLLLGSAVLAQAAADPARLAEAESLLEGGFEGISSMTKPTSILRTKRQIIERVERLFRQAGLPDKASLWRGRLPA